MLVELLCFFVALYILLRLWYNNYTKPWDVFEQAPLPRYTLLGHLPSMLQIPDILEGDHLQKWLENSKTDSVVLWVGCTPWLLTRNRLIFESILSSSKHISKSQSYWIFNDWLGDSVFLANGVSWRKQRKLLTPSFHFNILQDFVKTMEKHSHELVNALQTSAETGKTFNAFSFMKLYSIGIISETAMGIESNVIKTAIEEDTSSIKKEDREFLDVILAIDRVLKTILMRSSVPWYWYKFIFRFLPTGSQYFSDLDKIKGFAMAIIEKRIQKLSDTAKTSGIESDQSSSRNTIFLDKMIVHLKNGDIDVEDILHETQTFIFGGYDTVATAMSWCLYLLGRNKIQQEKAYEEAIRVKALGLPITESIKELHYIECVIKETLRIHPSAPMITRTLEEDCDIGGKSYPCGTWVMLAILDIQRDAKNFEDPMVFKPERFHLVKDGVNVKESRHYTYAPFSAGPRNCIGQKFAMMEMKTTLFHLLSEYEVIATQKEEDLIETFGVIHSVRNENGLEIMFRKR